MTETEVLARAIMKSKGNEGWEWARSIEDVPEEIGSYGMYDGIDLVSFGTTHNMRRSLLDYTYTYRDLKTPIMTFKKDTDGTDELWLDGKIRCRECGVVLCLHGSEFGVPNEEEHMWKMHGIDYEEDDD